MLPQLAGDGMQRSECDRWQQNLSVCLCYECRERKNEREGEEERCFQGKTFISHRTLVTDH